MKKADKILCAALCVIILASGVVLVKYKNRLEPQKEDEKMRGVWIASVGNIDFPTKPDLPVDVLKSEIDTIVNNVKELNLNTIYFQVHPCFDALYVSEIFKPSKYLQSDTEAPLIFDALEYMLNAAHSNNIKVYAWINPYRVTNTKSSSSFYEYDQYIISDANGKKYLNPSLPKTREIVVKAVEEIVKNYKVDGVCFDDYFYPNGAEDTNFFDDTYAFSQYKAENQTLGDYRRNCTYLLVKEVYEAVKAIDKNVVFGISPCGVWANKDNDERGSDTKGMEAYFDLYADTLLWANDGIIDFIAPQIYWSMDYEPASYKVLCDWWEKSVVNDKVDLYICHGVYKIKNNSDKAWDDETEIKRQLDYVKDTEKIKGSVFYGYSTLVNKDMQVFNIIKDVYKTE